VRRRFSVVSTYFVGRPKIDTLFNKHQTTVFRPFGAPYGMFEGQCGAPAGVRAAHSLRSLAGLRNDGVLQVAQKLSFISIDRITTQGAFRPSIMKRSYFDTTPLPTPLS